MTIAERPSCAACGSGNVYIKRDGTVVCRRCGHEAHPKAVPLP